MPLMTTAVLIRPGSASQFVLRAKSGFHTVNVRIQENKFITL